MSTFPPRPTCPRLAANHWCLRDGRDMIATMRSILRQLKDLLFPVQCAGCGLWDTALCPECARLAEGEVISSILDDALGVPSLELFSLGAYEGPLRSVILTAKHDPAQDLSAFLFRGGETLGVAAASCLRRLFQAVPRPLKLEGGGEVGMVADDAGHHRRKRARWLRAFPGRVSLTGARPRSGEESPIWVVPAPPSHARRRRRAEIVPDIAAGMVSAMRARGVLVDVVDAVELRSGLRGQGGRSARERWQGRRDSLVVRHRPAVGTAVIVVDDVVASGATIRALVNCFPEHVLFAASISVA